MSKYVVDGEVLRDQAEYLYEHREEAGIVPLTEAQEKAERNGVRIALEALSKLQKWNLSWEWMEESVSGEYIKIAEAKEALISILTTQQEKGKKDE